MPEILPAHFPDSRLRAEKVVSSREESTLTTLALFFFSSCSDPFSSTSPCCTSALLMSADVTYIYIQWLFKSYIGKNFFILFYLFSIPTFFLLLNVLLFFLHFLQTILPVSGIIVALKDAHVTYEMLHTLAAAWIAGIGTLSFRAVQLTRPKPSIGAFDGKLGEVYHGRLNAVGTYKWSGACNFPCTMAERGSVSPVW